MSACLSRPVRGRDPAKPHIALGRRAAAGGPRFHYLTSRTLHSSPARASPSGLALHQGLVEHQEPGVPIVGPSGATPSGR
jgi:hypothetical protein